MCIVPIKLTLKDKDTRFQAELTLKKACRVKTARHQAWLVNPRKVDTNKLVFTTQARSDNE
jgi:hypothetical protein